jgi:hypothetical protein
MRLSEAIRLGAMLKPQGENWLYMAGKTCALGAALDAAGALSFDEPDEYDDYEPLISRWPILRRPAVSPVIEWQNWKDVSNIVMGLNDTCHWTREQIADWVETIEAQQEQPVTEQPALVEA